MALTLPRWIALAVVLCGVALIAVVRPDGTRTRPDFMSDARDRELLAGRHVSEAAERLALLRTLDSVRRANPNTVPSAFRVLFAGSIPADQRRVMEALAQSVAARRPANAAIPVDLIFVLDTVSTARNAPRARSPGRLRADYVLPDTSRGARCIVLARLSRAAAARGRATRFYASMLGDLAQMKLLGPCAFYESFGIPGARIDGWLRTHGAGYALVGSWDEQLPPWRPRYFAWYRPDAEMFFANWLIRSALTGRGYRCVAGVVASCDSVLTASEPRADAQVSASVWHSRIVSPRTSLDALESNYWWASRAEDLGPRQGSLLAGMVHSLGTDRFRQFWRSDAEPRAAFRQASGQDLGDWVHDWARRTYGEQRRGPGVTLAAALYALGIIAAALGLSLVSANRRQMT